MSMVGLRNSMPLGEQWKSWSRKLAVVPRNLAETTRQLELAIEGARFGLWDWEIESGKATYGSLWGELLQFKSSEIPDEYSFWETRVHPDDINGLLAAKFRCMRGESVFFVKDHRLKTKDGEWVWVAARGAVRKKY